MAFRFVTFIVFAVGLAQGSGCGVQSAAANGFNGGPNPYVPDASDAGEGVDAPGIAAVAYTGSPICKASAAGGCDPDEPTTAQECRLAADGGAFVPTGPTTRLGCHVLGGDASVAALACLPAGSRTDGFPCARPTDCAPTYECVRDGLCQRYCCAGNAVCPRFPDDEFCDLIPLAGSPGTKVPVCVPTQPCTLFDDRMCLPTDTCAVVREDGTTSCVAVGPAGAGEECDDRHCARGLVCLGALGARHCSQLCHTATSAECAGADTCKGGLPLFPDPTIGICQ